MNFQIKNKYVVMIGALLAQLTIAGLYAWSIFGTAIELEKGWAPNDILLTYSIAQFVFALTTLLSGRLVDHRGPRLTIFIGGLLFGGGMMLSSFATTPIMLYLTFGVLVGAGVGFVYVCPLSTLVKWFPKNKGTITGLSVGVFGGGSILFKQIYQMFIDQQGVSGSFMSIGIMSFIIITIASLFVSLPAGYSKAELKKTDKDFMTSEMVKTGNFYKMWLMYWLAVIPGLLVLGAAKNIGIDAGLSPEVAAGIITILAISNASSRLVSGTLSDKFGTLNVLRTVFVITIVSLVGLSFFASNTVIFYLGLIGIAVGYGGFLSLFPTYTNQQFGSYRYASNYGVIYQAYGLAALSGIFIKSIAGTFTNTFIIASVAAVIGLVISFNLSPEPVRKDLKEVIDAELSYES
jgi:OFA family oxalate/formate antiporter-like MFS transporter